jgi:serine/threonine-protein kinase HipA
LDHELAMAYGDEFQLDKIQASDWALFSARTNTSRALLAREIRRMATAAPPIAAELATDAIYVGEEKDLVGKIAGFVAQQAEKLMAMAPVILKTELE